MTNEGGVGKPEKKPLLPRWLKFLLILVGTLLFLAAGAWVLLDIVTRQDLRAALAEVEALGWPLTPEELYPDPIPDEENAALVYDQAWVLDQPQTEVVSRVEDVEAWRALTEAEQTHVREALASIAQVLTLLHQAAQMQHCQFDLEYKDGYAMLLPHLSKMRNCVRWKRVASIVALADGRTDEALEHWLDSVAMVRHQEGQRILIPELVRLACLSISTETLKVMVQSGQLTDGQLAQAAQALEDLDLRAGLADGLRGQLVFARSAMLWFSKDAQALVSTGRNWQTNLFFRLYSSPLGRPWRQHDQATCVVLLKGVTKLAEQPYAASVSRWPQQEQKEEAIQRWRAPLTVMILPALTGVSQVVARGEARRDLARTALALERHRLIQGGYPDALTDLAPDLLPEVPLDPFDGKPLRYIKSPEQVAVYSVGPDFQDDGGSEEERPYPWRGVKDILFTVRRAPEPSEEPDDE